MFEWSVFEQIIAGLAVIAIGFIAAQYWRHRRLYLVSRFYPRSTLSVSGKAIAVTVLNRGHRPETNIRLELDPSRRYSLLAVSTESLTLNENVLQITTLPPRDEVGAVIEVDGGDFDKSQIVRFTSTDASGKVFDKLEAVPQPPGVTPAAIVVLFTFFGLTGYFSHDIGDMQGHSRGYLEGLKESTEGISSYKSPYELTDVQKKNIADLQSKGWRKIDDYARSELAQYYESDEFPVSITAVRRVGDFVVLRVDTQNKGNDWLTVSSTLDTVAKPQPESCDAQIVKEYIDDTIIPARSKASDMLVAYAPLSQRLDEQVVRVSAVISYKEATIYQAHRFVDISAAPVEPSKPIECTAVPNKDFKSDK